MCGDLLKEAEARLEIITNARLEWAMVCQCTCAACDKFYETVRDVMDADLKGRSTSETPARDPVLGDYDVFGVRGLTAETNCNQATQELTSPTPRGTLPNSLGDFRETEGK